MDYSFFDALIDAVFVINSDRGVVYCNESAAKLCDSSVRRLAKGKPIYEFIEFSDANLFVMPNGHVGENEVAPYVELKFNLKSGKEGKVQIAIQPFQESTGDKRWAIMVRDVTIEEVLHGKYHLQLEEKEVYIKKLEDAQKQLEAYSKNLEQMVEERTQQVKKANTMLSAIMNSLGQGFLVFDDKGVCSDIHTKACEDVLEVNPSGKPIADVLKIPAQERETFGMWMTTVFSEKLPFDALKSLGPSDFAHSQDRHVKLDFFPLRNEAEKISNVVVVATDQTSEVLANRALEREKKFAQMVIKLVTSKRQFEQFLAGVPSVISEVRLMMKAPGFDHESAFRALHTLEGEAGIYSAQGVWEASRRAQEAIEPLRKGIANDTGAVLEGLRRGLLGLEEAHDALLRDNSELFRLIGIGRKRSVEIEVSRIEEILSHVQRMGVSSAAVSAISDELLREPIQPALQHYDEVCRVVADKMGKQMNPIQFSCGNVRVYADRYQELFSSLVHAFRNAVDHGIESPGEREMMGKAPAGTIVVHAEYFDRNGSRQLRIKITDDGQGIDAGRIRKKLLDANHADAGADDQTVIQHVFDSGLTTRQEVGEFSGRGIGMNAILASAENLGGKAWVETVPGRGTQLFVEVPDLPRVDSLRASA